MPARLALAAVLTALALVLPHATAGAAIRSCGNARATGGFVIGDVIARRVSCRTAKRVARGVPGKCGDTGRCTVRGFSCVSAKAIEELRLARCSRDGLRRAIWFDWGS